MRITPQFMLSLVIFLDDLWFYRHHRANYSREAHFFMDRADLMNQLRYLRKDRADQSELEREVAFLYGIVDTQDLLYWPSFNIAQSENERFYWYLFGSRNLTQWEVENSPSEIYFLHSTQEIYVNVFLLNFFIFACLKLACAVLWLAARRFQSLASIFDKVDSQTHWWTFLVSVVETNMAPLSFACFL